MSSGHKRPRAPLRNALGNCTIDFRRGEPRPTRWSTWARVGHHPEQERFRIGVQTSACVAVSFAPDDSPHRQSSRSAVTGSSADV